SKATGFPIAKIAALLAVGYRLDEVRNDVTGETLAAFEPTLDYVVVKIPRFAFEKFPEADPRLTTVMKSVGEVMAIGRTFTEALGKALRSLERPGFDVAGADPRAWEPDVATASDRRIVEIERALHAGGTVEEVAASSSVDPWFVDQISRTAEVSEALRGRQIDAIGAGELRDAKRHGLSDARVAALTGATEDGVRERRLALGVEAVFKTVDTCAGEFEARTPYYYSTYEDESEVRAASKPRIVILGAGPNRIGQGIEFDYACVHAAFALREAGFETVMVNCNPETVSTDYDTSDRLYFEPLTVEDLLEIVEREKPEGVIVQFGGQTPLKLSVPLERAGVPILGTTPDAIDRAEDRERFEALLEQLGLERPPAGIARSPKEAEAVAQRLGYPVLLRPSYVLGGRAME